MRHEGDGDGELAREQQRRVDQAGGGGARVARGVAAEAVVEEGGVGVLADGSAHELAVVGAVGAVAAVVGQGEEADDVGGPVDEVGLAPRQQVRARLAEQVLHALGDDPGADERERQAQPPHVQLPQLALPYHRLGRAGGDGRTRHEHERHDEDDDDGDHGVADEQPHGVDRLMFGEGETVCSEQKAVSFFFLLLLLSFLF